MSAEDKHARNFLHRIFSRLTPRNFAVTLNGHNVCAPGETVEPICRLHFRSTEGLRSLFLRPSSLTFGEAFACGDLEVEGPLANAFELAERLLQRPSPLGEKAGDLFHLLRLGRGKSAEVCEPHSAQMKGPPLSRARAREAISFHYDLPVEFWRPWLDEQLVYSCAYFERADVSLEVAQTAKLDLICRKLRLQRGERFLDLGCGWGALVMHAAQHYGVEAQGVTLSARQAEFATERIRACGLQNSCRVEVRDVRDVPIDHQFDKVAAVGCIEHIPEKLLPSYFQRIFSLLRSGGTFLNHGITISASRPLLPGPSFIDRYIFPDHNFITASRTLAEAEAAGFEVRDLENLREHYALTLQHWLDRFTAAEAELAPITTPATHRIFRLYLAGSQYQFERGGLNLHQSLFVKPQGRPSGLPLTRRDWYRDDFAPPRKCVE